MANKKTPAKQPSKKTDDEDQDGQEGTGDEGGDDEGNDEQDQNQRINAIVTSRVKREMKAVNQQLQAMMQKLETMSTPKKEETEDDEDGEGDEGGETTGKGKQEPKADVKTQRQLARLQKELAEEKDARKKAEQAQKDERSKAERQEMVSQFDAALTEHGVTDPKLRRAALMSLEADGVMVRDEESGKIRFKGTDKYGMEVLYDPKAGVKQWVQSDGKSFIPAVDAGGSGTGAARQGIGNTSLSKGEFSKLSDQQKAAINLERACSGLPPLE